MEISFDFLFVANLKKNTYGESFSLRVCVLRDFLWEKKGNLLLNWGSG